ncbi:LRR-RLK [Heracleum sosnowskyi]|uniref:LRR-RLK n=1 Tax=Heracleum sosnowskyi TaxID=360622 RepID=A0AAD8MIB9_9APIA|nr:LRR-RLK [Heracleum sosnowskyi]
MSYLTPFLFSLFLFTSTFLSFSSAVCHVDDESGLLAFKSGITSDPSGLLSSWTKGTDCCTWNGVSCDQDNRVNSLSIYGQPGSPNTYLSGTISPKLRKLTGLSSFSLVNTRNITGPFPGFLFRIPSIQIIYIQDNKLSGHITKWIGNLTQLVALGLNGNQFTGNIPSSLSKLTQLSQLFLQQNQFSGKIPEIFTSLTNMGALNFSYNKFSGNIPQTLAHLAPRLVDPFPALKVIGIDTIDLSYNRFNLGQIPSWITSSPIISSLKLAKCGIKIKLQDWKPETTYYYDYIDLSDNFISGSAVNLMNSTEYLKSFSASNNQLKFDFSSLKIPNTLKSLDLSRNLLFGKVPKEISGLEKLNVSVNHLCGALPANKFPASAFAGNDCLCGSPLTPCKKG